MYLWTKREMGEFHGFLSGWCYWTNNLFYVPTVLFYLVGISVYAFGPKALHLADSRAYTLAVSLGLLWLMTVLNVRGLGVGKWVNNLGRDRDRHRGPGPRRPRHRLVRHPEPRAWTCTSPRWTGGCCPPSG